MIKRVMSHFLSNFFVWQYRKTLRWNPSLLYFRMFRVAIRLWMRRGGHKNFPSKIFHLKVTEKNVGNPSVCHYFRVSKNFMLQRVMSRFSVERFFCLTVPKHFAEEPFYAVFQKISGSAKVYGEERGGKIKISFETFLCHSAQKLVGERFRVSLSSGIEKFYTSECYVTFFC